MGPGMGIGWDKDGVEDGIRIGMGTGGRDGVKMGSGTGSGMGG